MTRDELREKVARAMVAKDSGPEGSALFNIHWYEFSAGYLASADAAIALCMEEAARVAEGNGLRQYTGLPLIDEIAAAIRALGKP